MSTESDKSQAEYDKGYEAGTKDTFSRIKKGLITKAGEQFSAGKDEAARLIRELARTLTINGTTSP